MHPAYTPHLLPAIPPSIEELALRQQYSQLCAEKCRLLSAIQQSNRAGRLLQKEIHRLLDFLAEVQPEDCLEFEESDDFGDEWLEESDSDLQKQEVEREERKVGALKSRYRQLSVAPAPRRRSSVSPERKPSKSRRNYKHLPLRDDGQVDLPVILGRGVHRTILVQIGEVEGSGSSQTDSYIYPAGFQSKRKYYTFDSNTALEKPKKVYYYCAIKKADGRSLFEISVGGPSALGDDEDETGGHAAPSACELLESGTDLHAVWRQFRARFSPELQGRLDEDFTVPEVFLGLEHDSLTKYLREASQHQARE